MIRRIIKMIIIIRIIKITLVPIKIVIRRIIKIMSIIIRIIKDVIKF